MAFVGGFGAELTCQLKKQLLGHIGLFKKCGNKQTLWSNSNKRLRDVLANDILSKPSFFSVKR